MGVKRRGTEQDKERDTMREGWGNMEKQERMRKRDRLTTDRKTDRNKKRK